MDRYLFTLENHVPMDTADGACACTKICLTFRDERSKSHEERIFSLECTRNNWTQEQPVLRVPPDPVCFVPHQDVDVLGEFLD